MIDQDRKQALIKKIDSEISCPDYFLEWKWDDAFYASHLTHFGEYQLTSDVTSAGTPREASIGYRGNNLTIFVEFVPVNKTLKQVFLGIFQSEQEALTGSRDHYFELLMSIRKSLTN